MIGPRADLKSRVNSPERFPSPISFVYMNAPRFNEIYIYIYSHGETCRFLSRALVSYRFRDLDVSRAAALAVRSRTAKSQMINDKSPTRGAREAATITGIITGESLRGIFNRHSTSVLRAVPYYTSGRRVTSPSLIDRFNDRSRPIVAISSRVINTIADEK